MLVILLIRAKLWYHINILLKSSLLEEQIQMFYSINVTILSSNSRIEISLLSNVSMFDMIIYIILYMPLFLLFFSLDKNIVENSCLETWNIMSLLSADLNYLLYIILLCFLKYWAAYLRLLTFPITSKYMYIML